MKKIITLLCINVSFMCFSQWELCEGIEPVYSTIEASSCDSYTSASGNVYTSSGTYTEEEIDVNGCLLSQTELRLNIINGLAYSIQETACMSFISESGITYNSTGIYTETLPGIQGCVSDVTLTIDLTINTGSPAGTTFETTSVCLQYDAPDGQTFNTSGNYTYTLQDINGCDSIIDLNLTVLNTTNTISETSICAAYTAPDGMVYNESGVYTAIIPNAANCDSIITINLTVSIPSMSMINEISCESYIAPDAQVYSTSGTYTVVIPNMAGCDSTITINLTITNPTTSTIARTVCGSYTAPDGQVYTTSGMKTAVIPNMAGCDSTITINLTANPNPVATASAQGNTTITASPAGMIYQWINCNTDEEISSATNQIIEPMSGSYAAIVTNSNGCVDTSNCVTVTNTANLDFIDSETFKVYPNPTRGKIKINSQAIESFILELYDLSGNKIKEQTSVLNGTEMDLNELNSGVYFLHITNQSKIEIIKISKY